MYVRNNKPMFPKHSLSIRTPKLHYSNIMAQLEEPDTTTLLRWRNPFTGQQEDLSNTNTFYNFTTAYKHLARDPKRQSSNSRKGMNQDSSESSDDCDAWMIVIKVENAIAFETAAKNWSFKGDGIEIFNLYQDMPNKETKEEWIYNMYGTSECMSAFVKEHEYLYEQLDCRYISMGMPQVSSK